MQYYSVHLSAPLGRACCPYANFSPWPPLVILLPTSTHLRIRALARVSLFPRRFVRQKITCPCERELRPMCIRETNRRGDELRSTRLRTLLSKLRIFRDRESIIRAALRRLVSTISSPHVRDRGNDETIDRAPMRRKKKKKKEKIQRERYARAIVR